MHKRAGVSILVIAGTLFILHGLWLPTKAWLSQQLISYSWHQALNNNTTVPPWPWADTFAVAELVVPRLNKRLVLLHGVDATSLAFSAGVMHQYAVLSPNAPFVVAGHRDSHFSFLKDLKMKDVISLVDQHGVNQLYLVEEILVIDDEVEDLMINEDEASLVLITCFPFNGLQSGGSLRYVIKAQLMHSQCQYLCIKQSELSLPYSKEYSN